MKSNVNVVGKGQEAISGQQITLPGGTVVNVPYVLEKPDSTIITIIDNETFDETVNETIDISGYRHAVLLVKTGADSGTTTLTPSISFIDSNNGEHPYSTLAAVSALSTMTPEELYFLAATFMKISAAHSGDSLANVTVELHLKS